MTVDIPAWILVSMVLVVINLITFVAFGSDKKRATTKARRIPEARLLLLVALGGGIGALAGQRRFRHKNRKVSFRMKLWAIIAIQLALLILVAGRQ